jgi:hypothetical protein
VWLGPVPAGMTWIDTGSIMDATGMVVCIVTAEGGEPPAAVSETVATGAAWTEEAEQVLEYGHNVLQA